MKLTRRKDNNGSFCLGNMFIEEFLGELSGDAVKLYLLLRYRQNEGLDIGGQIVEQKLRLSKDEIAEAFLELSRFGLVEKTNDEIILTADSCLKDAKIEAIGREFVRMLDGPNGDKLKRAHEELIKTINTSFFEGRMGRGWYDFIELCESIYRFTPETIYLLFSTTQKAKTSNGAYFSYVKKVAENWHDNGVTTEESAANILNEHGENMKFIDFVAKKLSTTRPFTQAERETIVKWKKEGVEKDMLSVMLDDTNRVSAMTIYKINQEVEKWIGAGLKTKEEVITFRENEKKAKKPTQSSENQKTQKPTNSGQIHFEGERKYSDEFYESLMNNDFIDSDKKG